MRKALARASRRHAALTFILAWALSCSRPGEDSSLPAVTAPASHPPAIAFVGLNELQAELAKLRGRGVLLDFWATWCVPCVAELPDVIAVAHEYESRGGSVLLVSYDLMVPGVTRESVRAQVEAFVSKKKIDVPVLIYDAPDYDTIDARFELPGEIPVTLAIDGQGRIVDRQEGRAEKRRVVELMQRALSP